jgi:hypothetical protein
MSKSLDVVASKLYVLSFAVGEPLSCQLNSLHGGHQVRSFYPITSISNDPPLTIVVANEGSGGVGKGIGSLLPHIKQVCHSPYGETDSRDGSVLFSQLSDVSSETLHAGSYTEASQTCTHSSVRSAITSLFAGEPDPFIVPYDGANGLLDMPFHSFAPSASLKLELPLSQLAESAETAGTCGSAITSPLMSLPLSRQLPLEADSFGSNASDFLEALMKEAHPTIGLDQVRTDLIDQLLVLTSGNMSTEVAALIGIDKGRWGDDINPVATLEACASGHREDVSQNCCIGCVAEPAIQPLLPSVEATSLSASQVAGPRVDDILAEVPTGICMDENYVPLLDFASSDVVPEWLSPPSWCYPMHLPC